LVGGTWVDSSPTRDGGGVALCRAHELDRIIVEYASDAIAELGAPHEAFTAGDRVWVQDHAAGSLAEIEKATLRLVTLYTSRNLSHAAARLGMRPVSLSRWLGRRELPR
jgi:ActR/RegA family two-component response regulator